MKYILSIDQGTTGTKVILVDKSGVISGRGYRAHQQFHPNSGWVEHDVEEIWNCIVEATQEAMAISGITPADITAVALANQGESVVSFSKSTGKSLCPAIVWSDRRTHDIVTELERDDDFCSKLTELTGLRLDPYFSATKMQWILRNVEAAQTALQADDLYISTLDSWMIYRLTGGKSYVTDTSTASRTLLLNIHTLEYEDEHLKRFEIPREVLPNVVDTVGTYGQTDPKAFLGIQAPIVVSLVDQPAALFGHLCLESGAAKCTYGTGCFLYMNTANQPVVSSHGLLTTLVWSIDGQPTYALDGGVYSAGSAIDWLYEIGLVSNRDEFTELVTTPTASSGVWFVPALTGLAAPYWHSDARGSFVGLSSATTRSNMVTAVLEGIAHRVADVVETMALESKQPLRVLRVDGGLTNIPTLMQYQADVLGITIEALADPDATARGAAYLARISLGHITVEQLQSANTPAVRYEPLRDDKWRTETRRKWRDVVSATRDVSDKIQ